MLRSEQNDTNTKIAATLPYNLKLVKIEFIWIVMISRIVGMNLYVIVESRLTPTEDRE